jgi:hypothetical protein
MTKLLKRLDKTHFAKVGDEFYLTPEEQDLVVCLNSTAFAVLENLDGFTSLKDIAEAVSSRTGIKEPAATAAVKKVADELLRLKLLEEVESAKPPAKKRAWIRDELAVSAEPEVRHIWDAPALAGGMFVHSKDGDISVIVPNVTDGPIKTCPPHTCTIPAGLFTHDTVIRTFDPVWKKNFAQYRRDLRGRAKGGS